MVGAPVVGSGLHNPGPALVGGVGRPIREAADLEYEHELVQRAQRGDRRRGPATACLAQVLEELGMHPFRYIIIVTARERVAGEKGRSAKRVVPNVC